MERRMYVCARACVCVCEDGGGGDVGSVHQGDYNISRLQMEAGK